MRIRRVLLAILLFDRLPDHSSVSIDVCSAGASPTACLGRLATRVCTVVPLMLLLTGFDSAALAQSGSAAEPAISQTAHSFAGFINEASQRFAIAPNWIRSVQDIESAGDAHARSPKGATGLMQIMPATWAELRERYNLGNDPYDPHDNILAGTAYLRELLDRYGAPGVFAAYNAGPSRYEEHLAGGSLPDETRAYVAKLANLLAIELPPEWMSSGQSSAAATLFVRRSDLMKTRGRLRALMPSSGATTAISAPRCFAHGPPACWRVRPSIGFGSIAMTKCPGSQAMACFTEQVARADGVWAMPSARALLVASLLTEPLYGCLGPSGNDRYRKRRQTVWGGRGTTTAGRRDKRGSPVEPQAIGMAWVPACRPVGARAAPCVLTNTIKGVFGTVCAFERWEVLP